MWHDVRCSLHFVPCSVFAGGFYSQLAKPGLRVVSLNTILYYSPNNVTQNMTDPAGQFEWLEKTLEKAAENREKVYKFLLQTFFCHINHHSDHHIDLYERCGWLNISVVKYALLFSVGVHHRPCASRVPALCQKHHSYKREL